MCGIAGMWGQPNETVVQEMLDRLEHRGPDAGGLFVSDAGVLGHRRLAIVDIGTGDQPIYNERRTTAIVVNGEVYNHAGLRERLANRHRFTTRSDSEPVLHLYEEFGSAAVRHLDGMFAFAVGDGDTLFIARDPMGIKPLYYGYSDGALVFGSELKALVGIADDIREFPAGSCFHTEFGFRRYYTVPDRAPRPMPPAVARSLLRQTLEHAVHARLMSDVPVGVLVSGGLDSSIVAALARRQVDHLHTFAVGLKGSPDLEAARVLARHLDTVHHEYPFTLGEMICKLPEIVYHLESFDQDLVRSAIPCYFASRLASDHVKVVLTGEGADELFAGYPYYRSFTDPKALHRELRRSVATLHNINLQRVDRMTMAHSIEGRVPFLDVELAELALTIPHEWKLCDDGTGLRDKWLLRSTFEDLLPPEIVWRSKAQFDEGTGTVAALADLAEEWPGAREWPASGHLLPGHPLRSPEELAYYRLFADAFPHPERLLANVARWWLRPEPAAPPPPSEGLVTRTLRHRTRP